MKSEEGSHKKNNKRNKKDKKQKGERSITIKDGDTLSEIAARNHTTVKQLKKLNNISGSSIRSGKKLRVK